MKCIVTASTYRITVKRVQCFALQSAIHPMVKAGHVKFVYTLHYRNAVVFVCADGEKWGGTNSMIEIIISVQAILLLVHRTRGTTLIGRVLPQSPRHFLRQTSERI
jgi:hypothetical protein